MISSQILYQFSLAIRKQAELNNDKLNLDYADILEKHATIKEAEEIKEGRNDYDK